MKSYLYLKNGASVYLRQTSSFFNVMSTKRESKEYQMVGKSESGHLTPTEAGKRCLNGNCSTVSQKSGVKGRIYYEYLRLDQ